MEDAIALFKTLVEKNNDIPFGLQRFQELRLPPMRKIWQAANTSIAWYEKMDELVPKLSPIEFAYSYMTRTGRVDHAEIRKQDPKLAAAFEALHPEMVNQ